MNATSILIVGIAVLPGMGLIWWVNSVLTKVDEEMLASSALERTMPEPLEMAKRTHHESG